MCHDAAFTRSWLDGCQLRGTLRCLDLLGMPYRLGGDGSDGTIDCIRLAYAVLVESGISVPDFQASWYTASKWEIARDLHRWGKRICVPRLSGDLLVLPADKAFAAVWQDGILYIDRMSNRVAWAPTTAFESSLCFRSREISSMLSE